MCGLFGWKLSPEALDDINMHTLAAVLSYHAQERGHDSWGIAVPSTGAEVEVTRTIGGIRETSSVAQLMAPYLMGHTRAATHGTVSIENAHPFHIGKIIGSHNGVLQNHKELNAKYARSFNVDSQHIFAHIAESLPLTEIEGFAAISYINVDKPECVRFGRSSGSSLSIFGLGKPDDMMTSKGLIWGSAGHWIKEVLAMMRITDYFEYDVKGNSAYRVEGYTLHDDGEFKLGNVTYNTYGNYFKGYSKSQACGSQWTNKEHDDWIQRYNERRAQHAVGLSEYEKHRHDLIEDYNTPEVLDRLNAVLKKKVLKSEAWGKGKCKKLIKQICNAMGVKNGVIELETLRKTLRESPTTLPVISTSVINVPPSGVGILEIPHLSAEAEACIEALRNEWIDG